MTPDYGDTTTRTLLAVLRQQRPTVRSVAFEVGRSVSHTHAALVELRGAGLVTWDRGRAATLRPLVGEVTTAERYNDSTAHASGTGAALTRNPAPWSARTSSKEGQRAPR